MSETARDKWIAKVENALLQTVAVVRGWHGEVAWDIYRDNCPELKPARDVLGERIKEVR